MKILILFVLFFPLLVLGQITLPWSTTYDCPEWTQSDWTPVGCSSLGVWLGGNCSGGEEEQITSAANMTAGDGGRGQRHWVGDGVNNNSGGLNVDFSSTQSELWIRWYIRYESGFQWNTLQYDKIIYIMTTNFSSNGYKAVIPEWYGSDGFNLASQGAGGGINYYTTGCGWATTMGGSTSDGLWHCIEVHIKMDTNGSNGVGEFWIDGDKKYSNSSCNFGTVSGWGNVLIGSNQRYPNNGGCETVDYDDIAINNTGYIGLLSENDTIPPTFTMGLIKNSTDSADVSVTNISADVDSLMYAYPDSATGIDTILTNTAISTTIASSGVGWKYLYVKAVDDSGNYTYFGSNVDSVEYFGSSTSAKVITGSGKVISGDGKIE